MVERAAMPRSPVPQVILYTFRAPSLVVTTGVTNRVKSGLAIRTRGNPPYLATGVGTTVHKQLRQMAVEEGIRIPRVVPVLHLLP